MMILVTLGFVAIFAILYFLTDIIWPDHKWRKPKKGQNKKDSRLSNYEFHKNSGDARKHLLDYSHKEFMELKVAAQDRLIEEASSEECNQWNGSDVINFKKNWQNARTKINKESKYIDLFSSIVGWVVPFLILLALKFLIDFIFKI